MSKNSGGLSREMEEQLWHLLAPCSEDELRKSFKALQKDSSNRYLQKESRPSTALKDNIGRDVIHRQPLFRGTEACKDAKNTYDGPERDGLPDGFGVKEYAKILSWEGILLPFGSIIEGPKCGPGKLIPVSRYRQEVGILHRFPGSFLLADDEDRIQSYEHCHKILERLRFVQKVDAIEKNIVENLCSVYYLLPLSFNP